MDYKRLYKTWTGTIPAGGSVKIAMGGFYIRFLESDATGLIAVNDGDPGVAVGGLGLSLPDGFENFRLTNPNGTDWTVTVGVSEGAIEDSRLNVPSGIDVNIADDPQGAAILAMMQNADDQRAPVSELGASKADGLTVAGYVELISPASNVNGAIVRFALVAPATSAVTMISKSTPPSNIFDGAFLGAIQNVVALNRPFLLPSGNGLYVWGGDANGRYSAGWDYLS